MSQASIISQMTQLTVNQIMTMCEMECGPFKEGKRNNWSANAGQFIVYGLESAMGFANAVGLCAKVEAAYKKGSPIEPVVESYLAGLVSKKKS